MHISKSLRSLLLPLCFFLAFWAQAQKLDFVQGQFIVQIDAGTDIESVIRDFDNRYGYSIDLEKKISPILNIYTINFDYTTLRDGQVLRDLLMHPKVEVAQHNHFVTLRQNIPNDPEFPNQWQYINNGQDGGVVGADIDMPEAWDYATGGLTSQGDTIVACIIDDGIDNDHPDILPNLFINHAEIPDNGIDDDNNGFVDDYRGWNTSADSDNVYIGGGHGTPVTGIIGARGNDGFGVAGVNWNVKLMIVRGGTGVESEVIEAYSYPLAFRRKYNETDGAEGAFVVSTNASWGVDFGQPADAPLWCAFYDTLGLEGIISCGATINGNQNVDEIGDLPTACSSDYLISVTNMNRTDTKVTGAGYGVETIDLGAFGAQTWTVASGGGFGGFGGTSGATPHVTGTVALAYSLPCENLMDLAKSNPGEAALLVKQVIYDGTDPNASLEGITTTGGRLNVNNTLELLISQYCGDCLSPFSVESTISEDGINLSWTVSDTVQTTNFRYRIKGETDWIEIENSGNSASILDTELCTEYEFQLQNLCDNIDGEWGQIQTITSFGCCFNPEEFAGDLNEEFNAVLNWSGVEAALSYNVRYRIVGTEDWTEVNTMDLSIEISSLENCSAYEFQVQTVCILASPIYSESIELFVPNCDDPCKSLPYCAVLGYNATEEHLALVSINDLENLSLSNDGYGDFTNLASTELMEGGSYMMTLVPEYVGNVFEESFAVWMDFNQNGEFDDSEKVLEENEITETLIAQVDIPEGTALGNIRMRVSMRYNTQPDPCTTEDFSAFGETEDYCVNIVEFSCTGISIVDTTFTSSSEIGIQLSTNLNVDASYLSYRKVGETDWTEVLLENEEFTVEALENCTEYELRTRTMCGNDFTEYTTPIVIMTQCVNSIEEIENTILLYPNPFNDVLILKLNSNMVDNKISYEIYNQLGSVIKSEGFNTASYYEISTVNLVSGVYYVRILENDETIAYRKVVKM